MVKAGMVIKNNEALMYSSKILCTRNAVRDVCYLLMNINESISTSTFGIG